MRNEGIFQYNQPGSDTLSLHLPHIPRKAVIGFILSIALVAFEIFNFDTTRYALQDLLGEVSFWGLRWATILAIAFCAIDFAGLARLFTPERGGEEPKAVWYLMGAWLLGATMNAIMTWWAVSLTLLSHDFGNEVLSRDQLLQAVPVFVAALVWLIRILFIGAFSVAGEYIFDLDGSSVTEATQQAETRATRLVPPRAAPVRLGSAEEASPAGRAGNDRESKTPLNRSPVRPNRVRQRPPMPVSAKARNRSR